MTLPPTDYAHLLAEVRQHIQHAQTRAVLAVNAEMVRLYWQVGQLLHARQAEQGWGAAVIPRLAQDIRNALPEVQGFSERNLKRMLAFHRAYADASEFVPQAVAQMPASAAMLYLPWQRIQAPSVLFEDERRAGQPPERPGQPPEQGAKPLELETKPLEQPGSALYLHWAEVPTALQAQLLAWAAPVREAGKVRQEITQATVMHLCTGRYLGRQVLAHLLNRHADDLWRRFLNPMVAQGQLKPAFPAPRDPRQAYTAAASGPLSDPSTP
jgi:hypothetical protein